MKKAEITCWLTILILMVIRIVFATPFYMVPVILLIGFIMGGIYYFFSLFLLNDIPLKLVLQKNSYKNISSARILGSIFLGFIYAMVVIAVVFTSLDFPGGTIMTYLSSIFILISLILSLYKTKKYKESIFYLGIIKRDVLILIVCSVLIIISFLPKETRNKIFPYPIANASKIK